MSIQPNPSWGHVTRSNIEGFTNEASLITGSDYLQRRSGWIVESFSSMHSNFRSLAHLASYSFIGVSSRDAKARLGRCLLAEKGQAFCDALVLANINNVDRAQKFGRGEYQNLTALQYRSNKTITISNIMFSEIEATSFIMAVSSSEGLL